MRKVTLLISNFSLLFLLLCVRLQAQEEDPKEYPFLEFEGQIQIQLNDGSLGSSSRDSVVPANNGLAPFSAADKLFERRFRPVMRVQFSPQLELDTEFEVDLQHQRAQTLDMLLNYKVTEQTTLSLGRYKVPFGWEGLRSSGDINTIERSDATVYLYPERDVGFMVSHQKDGLGEFALGTFLGQPRASGGSNSSLDVIGRAVFPISDSGVKLGLSGHVGTFRPNGTSLDIPVRRFGAELQWEKGPFKFESEALWSDGYNTASEASTKSFGYYFSGIHRIAEPLDLVLSYDRFDPDTQALDISPAHNASNARDRKLIGLNYYFSREPIHRLMLNYEMKQSLEGPALDTSGFRVRYQFAW